MKPRLDDYASGSYSQFGESGMIDHVLDQIGEVHRVAVEFGAGDGMSCSNTAHLWRDRGWKAILIEPDPVYFDALEGNAGPFDTVCLRTYVTPEGSQSIGELLADHDVEGVDVMSIDIDGDDWFILARLGCRPRIIVVETNPTVPPHLAVRQSEPGGTFGASLLSLMRVGAEVGYTFVGATHCNAFLVEASEAEVFAHYETDPTVLLGPEKFTYAVTDFAGRVTLVGQALPWGTHDPYVLPLEASAYVTPATDNVQQLRRGFETLWGPSWWLTPAGLNAERLRSVLTEVKAPLVCIDLTSANLDDNAMGWMWEEAEAAGYRSLFVGRVLGLIRGDR